MKIQEFKDAARQLSIVEILEKFPDDNTARAAFEVWRWPSGIQCPHCGNKNQKSFSNFTPNKNVGTREGLRFCGKCRNQFTATVGTILQNTKVSMQKWMIAFFIFCRSRENGTAMILRRTLGVQYRTAWLMARRIRKAMGMPLSVLSLSGKYAGIRKTKSTEKYRNFVRRKILHLLRTHPSGLSIPSIQLKIVKDIPRITPQAIQSIIGQNSMNQFVFKNGVVTENPNRIPYWNEVKIMLEMNFLPSLIKI